jgi:hypothetical protein
MNDDPQIKYASDMSQQEMNHAEEQMARSGFKSFREPYSRILHVGTEPFQGRCLERLVNQVRLLPLGLQKFYRLHISRPGAGRKGNEYFDNLLSSLGCNEVDSDK